MAKKSILGLFDNAETAADATDVLLENGCEQEDFDVLTRVGPHALVAHRSQADAQFVFDGVFGADQGSPFRLLSILQIHGPVGLRGCSCGAQKFVRAFWLRPKV